MAQKNQHLQQDQMALNVDAGGVGAQIDQANFTQAREGEVILSVINGAGAGIANEGVEGVVGGKENLDNGVQGAFNALDPGDEMSLNVGAGDANAQKNQANLSQFGGAGAILPGIEDACAILPGIEGAGAIVP